jgi:endonuclease/exonuclease/phosphatase family metal-dependent hydrolase
MSASIRSLALLLLALLPAAGASAQVVGDSVRLESDNPAGVPARSAPGERSFVRWPNGTGARVLAIDPATRWLQVRTGTTTAWVVPRYATVVSLTAEEDPEGGTEALAYVVGTWNLEHFREGASRGFPENLYGGPGYGPRTDEQYRLLAGAIRDQLLARLLVLNEVAGEGPGRSAVLDRLLEHLRGHWTYDIGTTGGSQRVAVLFDSSAVRRNDCREIDVPRREVQGADIFARDPFVCHFTLRDRSGAAMNDLLVVGLHLASGQTKNQNHDEAMRVLRERLHELRQSGAVPAGERDVLVMGDLNASRYDAAAEGFWTGYDAGHFRFATLSPEDGTEYPGTRLAGVPLYPRSQIDYILASGMPGGIMDELVIATATVHLELVRDGFDAFRRDYSDHLPVTVRVRVVRDDD